MFIKLELLAAFSLSKSTLFTSIFCVRKIFKRPFWVIVPVIISHSFSILTWSAINHETATIKKLRKSTIPLEKRNVKQATEGEIRLNPLSPGHSSPPQDLRLFWNNKVIASSVDEFLIPLTQSVLTTSEESAIWMSSLWSSTDLFLCCLKELNKPTKVCCTWIVSAKTWKTSYTSETTFMLRPVSGVVKVSGFLVVFSTDSWDVYTVQLVTAIVKIYIRSII